MAETPKRTPPPLGPGGSDHAAGLLRMGVGAVPVLGPALSELVTQVIPGVRWERIESFLRHLDERLAELEQATLLEMASEPTALELVEEGAAQAARALSPERQTRLAELVAKGITTDEQGRLESKRLLSILREIDDDQIVILASQTRRYARDEAFWKRHESILTGPRAHIGADQTTLDASTVYRLARERLVALGLLTHRFKKTKKGELPEFDDKTGMVKSSGLDITPSGRLLLRRIGVLEQKDW